MVCFLFFSVRHAPSRVARAFVGGGFAFLFGKHQSPKKQTFAASAFACLDEVPKIVSVSISCIRSVSSCFKRSFFSFVFCRLEASQHSCREEHWCSETTTKKRQRLYPTSQIVITTSHKYTNTYFVIMAILALILGFDAKTL